MTESVKSVVVITGANGALGSAVAQRCLAEGASVIAVERGKSGETGVERLAASHVVLRSDTVDGAVLARGLAEAEAELGAITSAVLAAGAWRGGKKFHEQAAAVDWRFALDANLEAASVALKALLPGMVERKRGSIVLVGSRSGVRPYDAPGDAAYAASKAALVALTQAVAAEVLAEGVRLNLVLPSTLDTPANRAAMPEADLSTWVSLESLSGVVSFLLSPAARDISGAAIPVYGRVGV